jgi:hypothetical protein
MQSFRLAPYEETTIPGGIRIRHDETDPATAWIEDDGTLNLEGANTWWIRHTKIDGRIWGDGNTHTEWAVMRHMQHGPSETLAVTDSEEKARDHLTPTLDWLGSIDEPTREATGIAAIELVRRVVTTWPDGGTYTGPWAAPDEVTP